jgi:hypothetical protein
MLQHAQAISIWRCVIAINEGFSRLSVLLRSPPLSLFDMFFAKRRGSGT